MGTVNAIGYGLKDYIEEEVGLLEGETIGMYVEDALANVSYSLASVYKITEGKIDVDFLLGIVGSYLIALNSDTLEEDTKAPYEIFDTTMVSAMESYVEVEAIEEDEDGEPTDTTAA